MGDQLLVRTWNLFHGRSFPETRSLHIERMVRLIVADSPDVVCLQEVPVWALRQLSEWSGMQARWTVTKRPLLGPLARMLHHLDPGHVRSPFTGQANAMLVSRRFEIVEFGVQRLNPDARAERRVCQVARLRHAGGDLLVANVHATNRADVARRELQQVERLVAGSDPAVVCGDFNVRAFGLPGFSEPLAGIDQILVRGLELVDGPRAWLDADRNVGGSALLSDHAPVEAAMIPP